MKKLLILFMSLLMIGCTTQDTPKPPTQTSVPISKTTFTSFEAGFDTVYYLTFYSTKTQEELKPVFDQSVDLAYRYHQLFDIYNNYEGINNIKTINDNAGIQPVEVDPVIIEMLKISKQMNELSNGEFDVTYGSVFKVWHNYRDEAETTGKGPVPNQDELINAQKSVGWEHILLDEEANTVYIDHPEVRLDVGGIAKGFATEKIAAFLQSKGIDTAIINFGGNNRVIGSKPDGSLWGLGIEEPGTGSTLLAVDLEGPVSVVTSGDYHRYYVCEDGNTYHHIIDPTTLYPATDYRSVTIFTLNSGYADALSTSLFTMSIEDGKALLNEFNKLHPESPASAIWVLSKDKETEDGFTAGNFFITSTEDLINKIRH
ncbi:MAG: FAD:protein FMN transferase [Erysipelotrichaceae bacterium]|nr:FAD:protein FMN transferase [Erysipelotrichaceae bacterium]